MNYADADSGVTSVELYAKAPGAAGFSLAATQTFPASPSGTRTFSYTPAAGDVAYEFAALAVDAAGNRGATPTAAQATTTYETTPPQATSASGAPPNNTPAGSTANITVAFSEPIHCGASVASCAAQFEYLSRKNAEYVKGSNILVAADGRSATVTFTLVASVKFNEDALHYMQSAIAADRVKDNAGNDLVTGVVLSPTNP